MDIQALLPAAQLGKSWSSSIRRNTQVSKINLWEIFKPEFVISSNYSPGWSHFQHSSYIYQPHRFFICIFIFLIYVTWNALLLQREELQLRARSRDHGAETYQSIEIYYSFRGLVTTDFTHEHAVWTHEFKRQVTTQNTGVLNNLRNSLKRRDHL